MTIRDIWNKIKNKIKNLNKNKTEDEILEKYINKKMIIEKQIRQIYNNMKNKEFKRTSCYVGSVYE